MKLAIAALLVALVVLSGCATIKTIPGGTTEQSLEESATEATDSDISEEVDNLLVDEDEELEEVTLFKLAESFFTLMKRKEQENIRVIKSKEYTVEEKMKETGLQVIIIFPAVLIIV